MAQYRHQPMNLQSLGRKIFGCVDKHIAMRKEPCSESFILILVSCEYYLDGEPWIKLNKYFHISDLDSSKTHIINVLDYLLY